MSDTPESVGGATRGATRLLLTGLAESRRSLKACTRISGPDRYRSAKARTDVRGESADWSTNAFTGRTTEWAGLSTAFLSNSSSCKLPQALGQPRSGALVGALNGILGDHLVEQENPLAIRMQLRQQKRARPTANAASVGVGTRDAEPSPGFPEALHLGVAVATL